VELRQFPHNMCRFNLSAQELRTSVLEPWVHNPWIEFGERKWIPHQATLTVLEGPRIPFGQLTMGRGWRTAQRDGREVTEALLEALAQEPAPATRPVAEGSTGEDLAADSLGLELLARIGAERAPLRRAWELAEERHPGSPASATLALAERAVQSLLRGRLVVLLDEAEAGGDATVLGEEQAMRALEEIASWGDAGAGAGVWLRRG
jgi:hypothetical protein